jgi:hypothetical protein
LATAMTCASCMPHRRRMSMREYSCARTSGRSAWRVGLGPVVGAATTRCKPARREGTEKRCDDAMDEIRGTQHGHGSGNVDMGGE